MATNSFRTMSTAAVLTLATADKRSEADVRRACAHFAATDSRSDFERAVWINARTRDGVKGADVAAETGISTGRVSQIRAPFTAALDAGIPFPTAETVAEWAALVTHVSKVYKTGKDGRQMIADAVPTALALDDIASKFAVFTGLNIPSKSSASREPRPHDDMTNVTTDPVSAPTSSAPTETVSTFSTRLAALLAEVETAAIEDLADAMRMVDELSDALDARAATVAETATV